MDPAAQEAHEAQVQAFIEYDSIAVQLHRRARQSDGAGGFIAWTDFNTACWDGSGTAYALQPLAVASVQVPGGIDAAIPYDFCLNDLTETAAPAAPTTTAPIRAGSTPL